MTQTERIERMEHLLNEAAAAVHALSGALEEYTRLIPSIEELTAYYEGPEWRQDYESDCAGQLPKNLPRGVLSEDAVYNLLSEIHELRRQYGLNPHP